jgi:ubiquinone biosynthesis protein
MHIPRIGIVSRTYRHINRYRQILTVLVKYGFGGLVDRLRIGQYLELGLHLLSREKPVQVEMLTTAERVRMVLEELGPTFIKLGQVLSTRPDVLPPEFIEEFTKLQQNVPPFPFAQVRQIVRSELGRPLEEVYEQFAEESIAAGSIAQVHRATLHGGAQVVVKVQRPNIRSVIQADLEILLHLATLVERHVEGWKVYHPSRMVEEFSRVLERELDFRVEAAHVDRFARQFANDPTIYVPKVYRGESAHRVLTLEYVDVVPVTDAAALRAAGFDPKIIAARGAELTLKQIFVYGFFHADPHPGNAFVLPGNVICLLDFGMMGRIGGQTREQVADLIYAVATRDVGHVCRALLRLTRQEDEAEPDFRQFERDVGEFIDVNITAALGDMQFGRLVHELMRLIRQYDLSIPPDLVTMLKAAATAERLVARLDPDLNMVGVAQPYIRRLKLERLKPRRFLSDIYESTEELWHLAREVPSGLRDLLRLAKRGALKINFEHRGLEKLIDTHERVANRVSFAIVVAALVVGSSLIVHSRLPPTWHEIPLIGLVGFITAGVLGFTLLVAIIRHGRL